MTHRKLVLGAVLGLLSVPLVLVLAEAAAFHVHNRSNGFMVSSGERREYLLYVPERYDRSKPTALVISLHGASLWGAAQRDISQWNRVAEREGFMVAYPSGVAGAGPRIWREDGGSRLQADVRFISELIDTLEAAYNIDSTMIFADGLSNGGGMAFALSCSLSDRIAAVGTVGAAQLLPFSWCTDRRPVPLINFHGTADGPAPYHGGVSWVAPVPFPDVQAWTKRWARRNRCALTPVDSAVAADVIRRTYTSCAGDAAVVLYTIRGGGHTWPGDRGGPLPEWFAGPTSRSIDASSLMWAFYQAHPLRKR